MDEDIAQQLARLVAKHGLSEEAAADLTAWAERLDARTLDPADRQTVLGATRLGDDRTTDLPEHTDRFEFRATLGKGAQGEVWRVWDRGLRRSMALKTVRSDRADAESVLARFVSEAQLTSQLRHPAIVPVHELGRLPDGRVFLDGSSWENAMDSLGTICHEETHGYNYEHAINPSYFSYWMVQDYVPTTSWIAGQPRSIIYPYIEGSGGDIYKDLYFVGTQGTYGFTELLDETTCYVNGLGGAMAGKDNGYSWGISARDGAVAFLYYVELYIRVIESQDPGLYAQLQGDPEVKDLIRDLWLRTHFLLQFADQEPQLGIYDAGIRTLLYRSDNQGALEDFLGYPLAASNCLP